MLSGKWKLLDISGAARYLLINGAFRDSNRFSRLFAMFIYSASDYLGWVDRISVPNVYTASPPRRTLNDQPASWFRIYNSFFIDIYGVNVFEDRNLLSQQRYRFTLFCVSECSNSVVCDKFDLCHGGELVHIIWENL